MRKLRFCTVLLLIILVFTSTSQAVEWEENYMLTTIHSKIVIFNYKKDKYTELEQKEDVLRESFEPTTASNGDVVNVTLYATGELVNLEYLGEKTAGIEEFTITLYKVGECGSFVKKKIFSKEIKASGYTFKLDNLEDGFYKIHIRASSKVSTFKSSTITNKDEGTESVYFFRVGKAGALTGHQDKPAKASIRDNEANQTEVIDITKGVYFSLNLKKGQRLYFNTVKGCLPEGVCGFSYHFGAEGEIKTLKLDEYFDESSFETPKSTFIYIAYIYEDGCVGPYAQGFVRYED